MNHKGTKHTKVHKVSFGKKIDEVFPLCSFEPLGLRGEKKTMNHKGTKRTKIHKVSFGKKYTKFFLCVPLSLWVFVVKKTMKLQSYQAHQDIFKKNPPTKSEDMNKLKISLTQ